MIRRCRPLRGRLEGPGRISIRVGAGFSWVPHFSSKLGDNRFCCISGLGRDSGIGAVFRFVIVLNGRGPNGSNISEHVQGNNSHEQNHRTTHVESLSPFQQLNNEPEKSANLLITINISNECTMVYRYF